MELNRFNYPLICLLLCGFCAPVTAATWRLNEFDVTGDIIFNDDFNDGVRNTPPTSNLMDFPDSNVKESGGYLEFDPTDGGIFQDFFGTLFDSTRDAFFLTNEIVDTATGGVVVQGRFDPMLTEIGAGGNPDAYGIFLSSFGGGGFLSVANDLSGGAQIIFQGTTFAILGSDPLSSATGEIVLELSLDQVSDTITPRYSTDGGTSFVDFSVWANSPTPLDLTYAVSPDIPGDAVRVGALGQSAVPIPAPFLLLGSGLIGLRFWRRKP